MVNLAASALKGSPLWNFTPCRSLNCQVVGLTLRQETASSGTTLPMSFESHVTSAS